MKDDKALTVSLDAIPTKEDIKKYIAPNATDKELFMFMNICKSYGLNPFKREVHFIKYGDKPGQTVVGYEMYLKRAEATGRLDGWSAVILDKGKPDERAQVTIHRKDRTQPFVWETYRNEFDKKQSVWLTMPTFMLKKVAISQGFRLCFPEELGGMPYIPEELPANTQSTTSEALSQAQIIDVEHTTPTVKHQDTPKTDVVNETDLGYGRDDVRWWTEQLEALPTKATALAWAKENAAEIKRYPWHKEFKEQFAQHIAQME